MKYKMFSGEKKKSISIYHHFKSLHRMLSVKKVEVGIRTGQYDVSVIFTGWNTI